MFSTIAARSSLFTLSIRVQNGSNCSGKIHPASVLALFADFVTPLRHKGAR
jgi:hypothetical protein